MNSVQAPSQYAWSAPASQSPAGDAPRPATGLTYSGDWKLRL